MGLSTRASPRTHALGAAPAADGVSPSLRTSKATAIICDFQDLKSHFKLSDRSYPPGFPPLECHFPGRVFLKKAPVCSGRESPARRTPATHSTEVPRRGRTAFGWWQNILMGEKVLIPCSAKGDGGRGQEKVCSSALALQSAQVCAWATEGKALLRNLQALG